MTPLAMVDRAFPKAKITAGIAADLALGIVVAAHAIRHSFTCDSLRGCPERSYMS